MTWPMGSCRVWTVTAVELDRWNALGTEAPWVSDLAQRAGLANPRSTASTGVG